jgi:hypothetical protein
LLRACALGSACAATQADTGGRTAAAPDGYLKVRAAGSTNPRLGLHLAQAQVQLQQAAEARRELDALLAAPATEPQVRIQASDLLKSLHDEHSR